MLEDSSNNINIISRVPGAGSGNSDAMPIERSGRGA